jgi:ribonuclease VapC
MIFVDASALVAIIANEPDADELANRLDRGGEKICSAVSAWETVTALCRSYRLKPDEANELVGRYIGEGDFELIDMGHREWQLAVSAYARYGKGRHPAALNMGDCFAYACAKANGAKLLYKGDDFAKTDLA